MPAAIVQIPGFQAGEVLSLCPTISDYRRRPGRGFRNRLRPILSSSLARHQAQEEADHDDSTFPHGFLSDGFLSRRQEMRTEFFSGSELRRAAGRFIND